MRHSSPCMLTLSSFLEKTCGLPPLIIRSLGVSPQAATAAAGHEPRRFTDATAAAGPVKEPPRPRAPPRRGATQTEFVDVPKAPRPQRRSERGIISADSPSGSSVTALSSDDDSPEDRAADRSGIVASSRQRATASSSSPSVRPDPAQTTRVRVMGKEALGKRGRHPWAPMLRRGLRCASRAEAEALLASFTVEPLADADGSLAWSPKPINAPIFTITRPRPDLAAAASSAGDTALASASADATKIERYRPISRLGTGSFGSVVLYIGDRGGPPLAVKSVYAGHAEKSGTTEEEFASLRRDFQEVASSIAIDEAPPSECGAVICSRLALEASRLGEIDLWGRDPFAWTVLLMEPWEGSLLDFGAPFLRRGTGTHAPPALRSFAALLLPFARWPA